MVLNDAAPSAYFAKHCIDGREAQDVTFPTDKESTKTMQGEAYLKHFVLPNFFFHIVTAYNLLRQAGVDIGKMDYLLGPQNV
jgi:hypothetical protein